MRMGDTGLTVVNENGDLSVDSINNGVVFEDVDKRLTIKDIGGGNYSVSIEDE